MLRKSQLLILVAVVILLGQTSYAEVKNVILMIGDGMGFVHVKAASLYAYGEEGNLPFEKYYRGEVTTHSADSHLNEDHATDSASSATAMATGQKVNDKVISERDGEPIPTILELLQKKGKATGLVTTVPITHATPACFGAHANNRKDFSDIANDYLTQSRPNILFGAYDEDDKGMTEAKAEKANYTVVKTWKQMQNIVKSVDNNSTEEVFIAGLFYPDQMPYEYDYYYPRRNPLTKEVISETPSYDTLPHLSEMTGAALNLLDNDPNGFFLMIEGGKIDKAGHKNNIEYNVFETLEFARAFLVVLDWARNRNDTLIVVTADHECGGLIVVKEREKGFMPEVLWGSKKHTGINVPIYATGQGAEEFAGVIDNTDIFKIIMRLTGNTSVAASEK